MQAAITQAKRYGTMIALLENAELEADRNRIRKAWEMFRDQFNPATRGKIVDAFYDADYETARKLGWD